MHTCPRLGAGDGALERGEVELPQRALVDDGVDLRGTRFERAAVSSRPQREARDKNAVARPRGAHAHARRLLVIGRKMLDAGADAKRLHALHKGACELREARWSVHPSAGCRAAGAAEQWKLPQV